MTDPRGTDPADRAANSSLGQLLSEVTSDLSTLLRQEVELAKAEVRQEATKAGKAAGMLGAAAFAGYLVLVLLSFALVAALSNVMDPGWAALPGGHNRPGRYPLSPPPPAVRCSPAATPASRRS